MISSADFVSGFFGGVAGVLVGHPLDTIKVIVQTSPHRLSAISVARNSSISSLYRGIKAPLAGLAALNTIVFGVHGSIMRLTFDNERNISHTLFMNAIAGSCAGLAQSIISSPIELLKTRSQINSHSILTNAKQIIYSEGGFRGLYRGFWMTVLRDCPAFATYFYSYESLIYHLTRSKEKPSTVDTLFAGGVAGALSWLVIYPIDVIKSRIQADIRYTSASTCLRELIHSEGFAALMRGCGTTLLRAFPTNGTTFTVFSWTFYFHERIFEK
ncbi:Mitochondrial basic amino acids transporter [Sarcoptes scabiei]|uniref:Mitochondrial basic amino acids transporter n=1 Tax=Sarcoptes scabiei TaxID=52283 RepID=A0A834VEW7_SARSC|nr:Mitochondrial basic amino acids transporter [Sarcoptes scabiei]